MRHRTALLAIGAAGLAGAATSSVAGWSLLQNPRVPVVDQEALWAGGGQRDALVLGIGGVVGAAWEACVLARLADSGWDARDVALVVGTSAGSLAAVTVRSGLKPDQWAAFAAHGQVRHNGADVQLPDPRSGPRGRVTGEPHPWAQAAHAVTAHRLPHLTAAAVGMLPPSGFSLQLLADAVDTLWRAGNPRDTWPQRATWIPAVDLYNGQRVVFGAPGEPRVTVGEAVAASCAVPGLFAPVRVNGRHYVDGGVVSFTSLDLAVHAGARRVLVLHPLAAVPSAHGRGQSLARRAMARAFSRAVARARHAGVLVHVIAPSPLEQEAMGPRLLEFDRGERIAAAVQRRPASLLPAL